MVNTYKNKPQGLHMNYDDGLPTKILVNITGTHHGISSIYITLVAVMFDSGGYLPLLKSYNDPINNGNTTEKTSCPSIHDTDVTCSPVLDYDTKIKSNKEFN